MFGFTINGKHSFNDFGIIIGKFNIPMVGDLKEYRVNIPGMQGSIILQDPDYQDRTIILTECYVVYDPKSGLDVITYIQQQMRSISSWLNPRNGKQYITFDDDTTKTYYGVLSQKVDTEIVGGITRKFTLNFRCDPFVYGATQQTFDQLIDTGNFVVTNNGDYEVEPVITIKAVGSGMEEAVEVTGGYDPSVVESATLTNPSLTIGSQTISWTGTINSGESLVIDCANFLITKGGINQFSSMSGDFPNLSPGNSNVSMTDSTSTTGGIVLIQYRERWL